MRSLDRRALLALVLFTSTGLAAVLVHSTTGQERPEIRLGVAGVPASLDPVTALDGATPLIARQVFETLVIFRAGSTDVQGGLATRWSVSRDGLTWTFTIRDDTVFHDGTPLTAEEVRASFQRMLGPPDAPRPHPNVVWAAFLRGVPGVVKEVTAPDRRTLRITLVQPYAPLLTVLAHPGFGVARPALRADGTPFLAGSGPFRVAEDRPGFLALEAAHPVTGSRAQRLVFTEVAGPDQAEAEMAAKTLDVWFPDGPPRRVENAVSIPGTRIGYLAFQTEKAAFSRRKVRQGIATAIDPALLGVALGRAAVPLQTFLPPGIWARREGPPLLGGDREVARRLLREGGWPRGLAPVLLVPEMTGSLDAGRVADSLVGALAQVGVAIVTRVEPRDRVRALSQAGDFDIALLEAGLDGGDPHLLLFPLSASEGASKGAGATNVSFYRDPSLDDLLIRASQLAFRLERQRLYARAQVSLADGLPWLPIYVRLRWAVVRPEVRGLRLHPTGFHRLDTLAIDLPAFGIPMSAR